MIIMQTLLIISMVFNALFIVLLFIVNNTWYKYTNKINEEWHEVCREAINELKEVVGND